METLILLIGGHALGDYPLQGEFLAKAKNRFNPVVGVPWYQALFAHSAIHAAIVALVTGIWWLGVLEFIIHARTDDSKCAGKIDFNQDQAVHISCKILWWLIAMAGKP